MMTEEYTLDELVEHSGFSLRTLRFYIQEGLLPGPDSRGKYAHYSQEHLERLAVIIRLKKMRLPLQEIRRLLENMTPEDIRQQLESTIEGETKKIHAYRDMRDLGSCRKIEENDRRDSKPVARSSALDYIRNLERAWGNLPISNESQTTQPVSSIRSSRCRADENRNRPEIGNKTWQRIEITDGVELHLRDDLNLDAQTIASKLIDYAKHLRGKQ